MLYDRMNISPVSTAPLRRGDNTTLLRNPEDVRAALNAGIDGVEDIDSLLAESSTEISGAEEMANALMSELDDDFEDIDSLLQQSTTSDKDDLDEELDLTDIESKILTEINSATREQSQSLADNMQSVPEAKSFVTESPQNTEIADEPDLLPKKHFLILIVVFALIVLGIIVIKLTTSDKTEETPVQQTYSEARYSNDTLEISDTNLYTDSMTISKYIVIDKDSCSFVFEGYAENARAFIKAYVDVDTYNRYMTGARVPIVYRRIKLNNTYYYMEVRLNI